MKLFLFIYDKIVLSAFFGLKIITIFLKKKKIELFLEGQKNWFEIIKNSNISNPIWFHCSSLGEFELSLPIIEKLKEKGFKIAVSFFSSSGYEKRKNHPLIDVCFYLPIDTKKNIEKLLKILNPQKIFLVKYEFWIQLLNLAKKRKIETYVICSTFSEKHFVFKWFSFAWQNILKDLKIIFVNDENSKIVLEKNGFQNVILSGDARFDRVSEIATQEFKNDTLEKFCTDKRVIIWGSCWGEELEIFVEFLKKYPQKYKHILAPHNISENYLLKIKHKFLKDLDFETYTNFNNKNSNILILNTIGHLANAYKYGHIAMVGGGFKTGLHNILEPLSHGLPVIFGNNYSKYPEAKMSIDKQVGFSINNLNEFENVLIKIECEYNKQKQLDFIKENKGATEIILSHFNTL